MTKKKRNQAANRSRRIGAEDSSGPRYRTEKAGGHAVIVRPTAIAAFAAKPMPKDTRPAAAPADTTQQRPRGNVGSLAPSGRAPFEGQTRASMPLPKTRTAILFALASYYFGGAVKLWIVVHDQTDSSLLAFVGALLLLTLSMNALFDLRVYPVSRELVLWLVKLFVAFLYVQHIRAANPGLCYAVLVLIDALAHLLLENAR